MKVLVLFFLFFCSFYFLQAQNIEVNNLKDYSYLLVLTKKTESKENYNVIGLGTGFFVRNNKKNLYLVSANHIFTGNDPINVTRTDSTSPDLMVFHYEINGQSSKGFKNIYLDSIKAANPPKLISKSPDLLAYKIDLPKNAKINIINGFMDNKLSLKHGDSLFFLGFPAQETNLGSAIRYYVLHPQPILYKGMFIKAIDSLNFMVTPVTNFGASGSPVFVRKHFKGKDKMFFVGVLSAGSDIYNLSFVVKYKELLKSINVLKYQ